MSVLELSNKNKMSGSIDIIMGCMFSGKSTELIRLANRYRVLDMNVLAVNHCLDNRYHESAVATHSDIKMDCLSIKDLSEIKEKFHEKYEECQVLIIEEAQFFPGLYDFVLKFLAKEKSVKKTIKSNNGKLIEFGKLLIIIPLFFFRLLLPKYFKDKLIKDFYKKLDTVGYSFPIEFMKFKVIKFLETDIIVPVEPEDVLKYTYGNDWKTPKQNYVWHKEAKNLFRQSHF